LAQRRFDSSHRPFRWALARVVLAVLVAGTAPGVRADVTFTVNTVADEPDADVFDGACRTTGGACSLRAATMQANHLAAPGVAYIQVPDGVYGITIPPVGPDGEDVGDFNLDAPLIANQRVEITGAGSATTIIDGNLRDRLFNVAVGRNATLRGLTLRNGRRTTLAPQIGGAITNDGVLTVDSCVIESNAATGNGGGIYNRSNLLTITDSVLRANSGGLGGAICSFGAVRVLRSTISSNDGGAGGGGIFSATDALVRDSLVSGNHATYGGGIYAFVRAFVVNTTVSGNYALIDGGGIRGGGITGLYNSTVVDNDADHDHDENGGTGGGVHALAGGGARFIVVNSLIARNTIFDSPIADDCNGTLEAYGMNLFTTLTGCDNPNFLAIGGIAAASIGPLQDNGGPTPTHAISADSTATNGTNPALGCVDEFGVALRTDQRGAPRTAGARCDVGAFEFDSAVPPPQVFANGFE